MQLGDPRRPGRPERASQELVEARRKLGRQRLAARHHPPERAAAAEAGLREEDLQHRRHEVDRRHPLLLDPPHQVGRIAVAARPRQHQPRADGERPEQLPDRHVEGDGGLLQHAVVGREAVGPLRPGDPVDDAAVGAHDALRPPRRARGVDDVGEVVRPGAAVERGQQGVVGVARRAGRSIEVDQAGAGARHGRGEEVDLRQEHRLREAVEPVLDHEGQPLRRIGRVERQVGAAGLQDGEETHDERRRAVGADRDRLVDPHPQPAQAAGQAVGAGVELAVGERFALADDRRGARRQRRLPLDPAVQQGLGAADPADPAEHRREVRRRVVQLDGHLLPLGRRQQLDRRHAARRVVRRRRQQAEEVPGEARHRGAVEEVGAVLEPPAELSPLLGEGEAQVEAGDPGGEVERLDREAAQGQRDPRRAVEREHRLHQRRAAAVALDVDLVHDALEGDVGVIVRRQGRVPHPRQELGEARIAAAVGAQGEHVEEDADERLQLRPGAVRDRRADGEVGLPGMALEEGVPDGEDGHEDGRLAAPRQAAEGIGERRRQVEPQGVAAEARDRRPRAVGREVEGRRAGEPLLPVGELRRERLLRPGALPGREVGVLEGQRGERRRLPRQRGGVEGRQLAPQHPLRPAVRRDVVEGEEEGVLVSRRAWSPCPAGAAWRGASGRAGGRSRGRPRGRRARRAPPPGAPAAGRRGRRAAAVPVGRRRRADLLPRLAVRDGDDPRAQRLVAAHDLGQGGGERRRRERPAQEVARGDVVGRALRRQPVHEIEPPLRVGQRQDAVPARERHDGGGSASSCRPAAMIARDGRGEAGDRRRREHPLDRQVGVEGLAEARQQANDEERMAAEVEEVVVDADRMVQAEQILPDPGDHLLDGIAGRRARRGVRLAGRPRLRRRQRPPVDLAVGVERQLCEGHES